MAITRLGPNQSVNLASNVTGTLPVANGGTNLTSGFVNGGVMTPYFEAYIAANQSPSDNTDTKVNFDTETYDSGGMYDTTNKRFLPTVAGKYFIYFQVTYDKQGVDAWHNCHTNISKNGSTHKQYYTDFYDNYDPYAIVISGHTIMDFNGSSDYVEIFGNFNVTSGTGVVKSASQSTFGGFKLIGA